MLTLVHAFNMDCNYVLDYYNAHEDKWHDLNNYAVSIINEGFERYIEYVEEFEHNLYFLIDTDNPTYILGSATIDDSNILNFHKSYLNVGHIGYSIRPSERNKGYGTYLLYLVLRECEKNGMKEACVSCHKDNIASRKVIENNKGKLEKEFFDDDTGKRGLKYWIKLHPRIDKRLMRSMHGPDYINHFEV